MGPTTKVVLYKIDLCQIYKFLMSILFSTTPRLPGLVQNSKKNAMKLKQKKRELTELMNKSAENSQKITKKFWKLEKFECNERKRGKKIVEN